MEAPTPVSALVHAGLVSGAGLLLLRLADPFVSSAPAVILAFTLAAFTVVLASAGATVVGFRWVLLAVAACYLVAGLCFPAPTRR